MIRNVTVTLNFKWPDREVFQVDEDDDAAIEQAIEEVKDELSHMGSRNLLDHMELGFEGEIDYAKDRDDA